VTPLTQVIIPNRERLAFSGSVTVRTTRAATFLRVHQAQSLLSVLGVNADLSCVPSCNDELTNLSVGRLFRSMASGFLIRACCLLADAIHN